MLAILIIVSLIMGNVGGPDYKCPEHQDKIMTTVCTDPRCIEPLCDICL